MAFPRSFLRLRLRWLLAGGEVANTTVAWDSGEAILTLDELLVDALAARADAFWTAAKGPFPGSCNYVGSQVTWVDVNNHAVESQDRAIAAVPGGTAEPPLPTEVAMVLSLRTPTAGRRTRGRMYLPNPAVPSMGYDARYTAATIDPILAAAGDFLTPLTFDAATFVPVVASATGGLLTPVTVIAIGNVPDAQRRRRDNLIEAYSTHTL